MAQFNIDIPGVGTVTVDGNFATEDSINRLASAMGGGSRSNRSGATLNDINRYGGDVADSLHALDPVLRKNTDGLKKNKDELNKFGQGFSRANGLLGDMSDPGSGTLTKFVKSIGEVGSSMASIVPYFGGALSGALGAFTGLLTEAIGFAQGLIDTNKAINTSGIALQGGLKSLQLAAEDADVPFQQFAKSMMENSESLRLMSGGAPGGIMAVSKAMKILTKGNNEQYSSLLAMGYSIEDIMGAMTDFGVNANMVGKSLNPKELAEGTTEYLKSQQELNRLTGMDIKQAKEKSREQDKSLFVQKQLNQIQDPEARKRAAALLAVSEKIGIDDFVASGSSMTTTSGLIVSNAQQTADALRNLYLNVDMLSPEEFNNQLAAIMSDPQLEADLKDIVNTFGDVKSELYKNVPIAEIENFRFETLKMIEAAKLGGDFYKNYEKNLSDTDKAMVTTEQAITKFNSMLSGLGFLMFNFIDGYLGTGGDVFTQGIEGFTSFIATMDQLQTAQEALARAKEGSDLKEIKRRQEQVDELQAKFDKAFTDVKDPILALAEKSKELIKDMATSMGTTLSDFTSKFMTKLDALLGSYVPGYESAGEKEKALEEFRKNVLKVEPGQEYTMTQDEQARLPKMTQQDLKDLGLESYTESESYLGGLFQTNKLKFKRRADDNVPADQGKPQALGGIFNYKPGGELVTVAEAGPELVAPAKRTKEGKLGLEVSGAQLDNSQLLRSLVEINKGQADLMASLNGKIDKLVSEQRQANRLST